MRKSAEELIKFFYFKKRRHYKNINYINFEKSIEKHSYSLPAKHRLQIIFTEVNISCVAARRDVGKSAVK